jgi:hypothetical protein
LQYFLEFGAADRRFKEEEITFHID